MIRICLSSVSRTVWTAPGSGEYCAAVGSLGGTGTYALTITNVGEIAARHVDYRDTENFVAFAVMEVIRPRIQAFELAV